MLWKTTGTIANELQTLTPAANGYATAEALDINDSGVIVGDSEPFFGTESLGFRPTRWTQTGVITQLNVFNTNTQGYAEGKAIGVNKAGVIVAKINKYNPDDSWQPLIARYAPNSAAPEQLMSLGGGGGGYVDAEISSISDAGMILGYARQYFGSNDLGGRPVSWHTTCSTAAVELPNLGLRDGSYTSGRAESANASGVIAGYVEQNVNGVNFGNRAVIWTTNGGTAKVIDLNTYLSVTSPWTLTEADSISDTGFVSGIASYASNISGTPYDRAFTMLVPQAGTYGKGDANFDTVVSFDDLVILAQHYNQTNASQNVNVGDFNLDGVVNFDDLVKLAQNYSESFANGVVQQGAAMSEAAFAADWALAQSLVPEPTGLGMVGAIAILVSRRRLPHSSIASSGTRVNQK